MLRDQGRLAIPRRADSFGQATDSERAEHADPWVSCVVVPGLRAARQSCLNRRVVVRFEFEYRHRGRLVLPWLALLLYRSLNVHLWPARVHEDPLARSGPRAIADGRRSAADPPGGTA